MALTDLHRGFRDDTQRRRAADVVMDRLTDDRQQEECHCLLRFWWQLSTGLHQIDVAELAANVSPAKMTSVRALVEAIRSSPEAIDAWIETTSQSSPTIQNRKGSLIERPPLPTHEGEQDDQVFQLPPHPRLPDPPQMDSDLTRAATAYRLAGESDPRAFYQLGWVLHVRGEPDYRVAAAWHSAAEAGSAEAMYALAILEGERINRSEHYLRQAAAQEYAPAHYALGYRAFCRGEHDDAMWWWTEAAGAGLAIAQQALDQLRADLA